MPDLKGISVVQLGARMHYAVPAILQRRGMLQKLYTDIYATPLFRKIMRLFPAFQKKSIAKKLLGRYNASIPTTKIIHYPFFGFNYLFRQASAKDFPSLVGVYNKAGRVFAKEILKSGIEESAVLYLYNGAGAELMKEASKTGIKLILEQTIAPFKTEQQLLFDEYQKFPEWNLSATNQYQMNPSFTELIEREQEEWEYADKIICGSDFVRDSINKSGKYQRKSVVVPYGVDATYFKRNKDIPPLGNRKLNILVVGVGLRKGTQYILEVADQLRGLADIRIIGSLNQAPKQIRELITNKLNWIGHVPRTQILEHYQWADLLLLPSVCEGSATVSYEALSMGIPVIATLNAGTLVKHRLNGYIIDLYNSRQILEAIGYFYQPGNLEACSLNTINDKNLYGLDSYETNLINELKDVI